MQIHGTVAPGFEPVRALYEERMRTLAERNTQLCVYVGEERVVDLWASAIDDADFSADSLVNVFSSGKSLEAITLAMLVDQDLLAYDAPIAEYWPGYAANGKGATTVADLMRHEAGLAAFDTTIDPADLHQERLQANALGPLIEAQVPRYRDGSDTRREYHAITRGWIANELFRRVEPDGRTMGRFLRDELATPLGADVHLGLCDDELPRINPVVPLGWGYQFAQSLVPKALGRRTDFNLAQLVALFWNLRKAMKNSTRRGAPEPIRGMGNLRVFDSLDMARGETPSAAAKCSARGLARLAAVMANTGQFEGRQWLGDAALAALHGAPVRRDMLGMHTTFSQGGVATFPPPAPDDSTMEQRLNHGREGYVGWMGLGGSIFQWHPEQRIGFAYVPTSLNILDLVNARGKAYQTEVLRCVAAR